MVVRGNTSVASQQEGPEFKFPGREGLSAWNLHVFPMSAWVFFICPKMKKVYNWLNSNQRIQPDISEALDLVSKHCTVAANDLSCEKRMAQIQRANFTSLYVYITKNVYLTLSQLMFSSLLGKNAKYTVLLLAF